MDIKLDDTNSKPDPAAGAAAPYGGEWGESVKQVPNWLTTLRFVLVPIFVVMMNRHVEGTNVAATLVFLFAAATDWLDGYLARYFKAESILGTVLDPLADKILVMAALVMLAALPDARAIPAWMVVVLLSREMIITGLRSLAALKNTVVPATTVAKHKTAWTFLAIVLLLLGEPMWFPISFHTLGMTALWIAMLLSVISGFQYGVALRRFYSD